MKRCIILIAVLLFTLSACSNQRREIHEPVNYYYLSTNPQLQSGGSMISCEIRDKFGHTNDYTYLLEDYLLGPKSAESVSPFPAGTGLIHFDLVKDTALVNLTSHLALLKGHKLTMACACLGRTVLEITGMKSVQISAQGELLDGKEYISITSSNLALIDSYVSSQ